MRWRHIGQLPSVELLSGCHIKADDPTELADCQLPAVRAERPPKGLRQILAEHRFPVGHTPHTQWSVVEFECGQILAVGAELPDPTGTRLDALPLDVLYFPVVRNTADADDPLVVDTRPELELRVEARLAIILKRDMPVRSEADIRQ